MVITALFIIARHKRTHTVWFHLYEVSTLHKFIEKESRREVTGTGRQGKWVVIA